MANQTGESLSLYKNSAVTTFCRWTDEILFARRLKQTIAQISGEYRERGRMLKVNDNDGDIISKVTHNRLRQRQEADQTFVLLSYDLLGKHVRIIAFQVGLSECVAQQVGGRISIENLALLLVPLQL